MDAAATTLITLPLSTNILTMESAIFVNVEKMEVRRGSSLPDAEDVAVRGPPVDVSCGMARATVRSKGVNGWVSLMMHPKYPGFPSNPAARSGSAS